MRMPPPCAAIVRSAGNGSGASSGRRSSRRCQYRADNRLARMAAGNVPASTRMSAVLDNQEEAPNEETAGQPSHATAPIRMTGANSCRATGSRSHVLRAASIPNATRGKPVSRNRIPPNAPDTTARSGGRSAPIAISIREIVTNGRHRDRSITPAGRCGNAISLVDRRNATRSVRISRGNRATHAANGAINAATSASPANHRPATKNEE